MDIILHFIGGIVLIFVGIIILLYTTNYGVLVMDKETDPSIIVAIMGVLGVFVVLLGVHLLGISILLSLLISIVLFYSFLIVNSFIREFEERSVIDNVIAIILYLLIVGTIIFVYYGAKVSGVEESIDSFFK